MKNKLSIKGCGFRQFWSNGTLRYIIELELNDEIPTTGLSYKQIAKLCKKVKK
jgi:hypothetical protein